MNSPQLSDREFFHDIDHPEVGTLRYPGMPFKMSETPYHLERAPRLGEHNEEIYCGELGYTANELTKLQTMGII
jgi:crotonobetainyl-CoA:carnitine CoA-transferase CaiB-like acyl-CoA transferase